MPEPVTIRINDQAVTVAAGTTVAAAMLRERIACRISVNGRLRAPLCGIGICFECRAIINGTTQQRTCQLPCAEGMVVETQP